MLGRDLRSICALLVLLLLAPACGDGGGGGGGGALPAGTLSGLILSTGTLTPAFGAQVWTYSIGPGLINATITVTATAVDAGSTITVNGTPTGSGVPSAPIAVPPGASVITIVVTPPGDPAQTYIITLDRDGPQGQEAYLKASNTDPGDNFGWSISMSGDTLVVGARFESSSATGVNGNEADNAGFFAGAGYVFRRTGGVWAQEAYLKASNTEPTGVGDQFGESVAISGDTLVVGARAEDSNATGVGGNQADNSLAEAGAAYVFTRTGTVWTQEAYLKASNTNAGDFFGDSVAIDGDTIVIGTRYEESNATGVNGNEADNSLSFAGAAYVFKRTGGIWAQEAYLKASNTDLGDWFGDSVAISGDTIVVGARSESSSATGVNGNQADNSAANAGAAYVFTRTGTVWSQQAYLKASNAEAGDSFGAVSIDGDTIVVGAGGEDSIATGVGGNQADNSAAGAGAAYVFTRTGTVWTQEAYLKASNTELGDGFGGRVALSGDALVVGAIFEASMATGLGGNEADNSAVDAGALFVFTRTGSVWSQESYIKASNTDVDDAFAWRVTISGDTIAASTYSEASSATGVGGNQADNSAAGAGAAYVYR